MTIESDFISSARSRIGAPFRHHFRPNDFCLKGRVTVQKCMESGMSDDGYDCSGLVIASLCDVLGLACEDWPINLRHQAQIKSKASDIIPNEGDIVLFRSHIAIYVAPDQYIHASGISREVEEGRMSNGGKAEGAISLIAMIALGSRN